MLLHEDITNDKLIKTGNIAAGDSLWLHTPHQKILS